MLDACQAFKLGFLSRCAAEGVSLRDMPPLVKSAGVKLAILGTLVGKAMDVGKGVAGATLGWGIPLAVAAPPLLGGLAGFGLAKATDVDDTDVDDIKAQERIEEYKRQTARLDRQRLVRDYAKNRRSTGRVFS